VLLPPPYCWSGFPLSQLLALRVDTGASTWERGRDRVAQAIRTRARWRSRWSTSITSTTPTATWRGQPCGFTDALRNQLRAYDLAGRFGGEEFAILLPQAREIDALNVAERLRAHVAAMSIPVDDKNESGQVIRLTISVGVAALNGESRELTDMLAAADAALYHAKETGRNKTHVISASAPTA
jgi:hypothetical protein